MTSLIGLDKSNQATHEYSPFGELIRASGPVSRINPLRWSTKFTDEETGLSYYGYRYYSASMGRWLRRDPIGEKDGLNLYAFCVNRPFGMIDPDGAAAIELDANSLHVHLERGRSNGDTYSFSFDLQDNSVSVGPKPGHKYPGRKVSKEHWEEMRLKTDTAQKVLDAIQIGSQGWKDTRKVDAMKRWAKAGMKLGAKAFIGVAALGTMANVTAASTHAGDVGRSYAFNRLAGNTAEASLDIYEMAILAQEMTGNYFFAYAIIDALDQ